MSRRGRRTRGTEPAGVFDLGGRHRRTAPPGSRAGVLEQETARRRKPPAAGMGVVEGSVESVNHARAAARPAHFRQEALDRELVRRVGRWSVQAFADRCAVSRARADSQPPRKGLRDAASAPGARHAFEGACPAILQKRSIAGFPDGASEVGFTTIHERQSFSRVGQTGTPFSEKMDRRHVERRTRSSRSRRRDSRDRRSQPRPSEPSGYCRVESVSSTDRSRVTSVM